MKAMILEANAPIREKPLKLVDLPKPRPGNGEICVRVTACGICRTDLHVIEGELPAVTLPIVPGHQVVGEVDALGEGCAKFKKGNRVGIAWLRGTCGECGYCQHGKENLCDLSLYTGYHVHGGYAEYAVINENYAYEIPKGFSDQDVAPLLCSGIIGYHAFKKSAVPAGGSLALYGFGASAHVTLQVAKHFGCEVFVATRGERHKKHAKSLGADWVGDTYDALPKKVDSAIVFAPAGEVVPAALSQIDKGGTVALAGIYMTPIEKLEYEKHLFHEKTLISVEANTREHGRELLQLASEISIKPTVTTFPLEQANEALLQLYEDGIDGSGVLIV